MSIRLLKNICCRRLLYTLSVIFIAGCGSLGNITSDVTPPKLIFVSPANGAVDASINSIINATFSENVSNFSFSVTSQNGNFIKGTTSGSGSNTVSFAPAVPLNYGTKYTVKITTILDSSGNKAADVTWSFSTSNITLTYHATPDSHNYDVGRFNSTAVSPVDGKAYISYFNTTTRSLYVISTADGTSFNGPYRIDAPVGPENVGQYSSLAIDAGGNIHVSYYHETSGLKYATASDIAGAWNSEVVDADPPVGTHTSLALDINGMVHISYYDAGNTALKYATNAGGQWRNETVDSGLTDDNPGQYTSIKVGTDGLVHISYYDFHASILNGNLKYVSGTFGSWIEPLTLDSTGDVGQFSSLALFKGKVYITYNHLYPDGRRFIRIITNASGEWRHQDIAEVSKTTNDTTSLTSNPLVCDSNGTAHISYFKAGVLYYATGVLSDVGLNIWDWAAPVAVDTSELGQGIYASMALDANGRVKVAYYDATDGDLKFAQ
jgi:hypothetical protein